MAKVIPGRFYRICLAFNPNSTIGILELCRTNKLIFVIGVESYKKYRNPNSLQDVVDVAAGEGGWLTFIYEKRILQTLFYTFNDWLCDV